MEFNTTLKMEDIFIQALVERSKKEQNLMDSLPKDIKLIVEEKLQSQQTSITLQDE